MKTSATNRKLRLLLTAIQKETLIPRPEFQRRLVWANKHKLAFLKTVLEGYPFPEIYIAAGSVDSETGEGTEMLVDGQQRISTLSQYFKGSDDLQLSLEIPSYKNLSEEKKIAFLEYEVVIRDLGALPIKEILEVFQRINSTNYALNAMEIHNARFDGEFKELGDELAADAFFEHNRFFTAQEIRRMNDTRFCLNIIATVMSGYFNRDDIIEKYLETYNENFDQKPEIKGQIAQVFEFITKCNFDTKSRIWKKADLFTAIIELHRTLFKRNYPLTPDIASKLITGFLEKVEDIKEANGSKEIEAIYYKSALQGSNDRGNRIKRGEIFQSILDPSYEPKLDMEQGFSDESQMLFP